MGRDVEIAHAGVIREHERARRLVAPVATTGFEEVCDRAGAERVAL
jgi:hypothetical protein